MLSRFFLMIICVSRCLAERNECWNPITRQTQHCYPDFYDAAKGRKPDASSTCGVYRVQEFCHDLPQYAHQSKCEQCNDTDPYLLHSSELMTDGSPMTFWASETLADDRDLNSKSIFITIDLGGQHEVLHTAIIFASYRPQAMILHRKFDDLSPWTPWAYFSQMCIKDFHIPAYKVGTIIRNIDEIVCYEFIPATIDKDSLVRFEPLENREGESEYFKDRRVLNWVLASQVRLEIRKLYTHTNIADLDHQSLQSYFAAISTFSVMARMFCNGHGNEFIQRITGASQPRRFCLCDPNHYTTGQNCEMCLDGFKAAPWMPATLTQGNPCKECNCNGNSKRCEFHPALYVASKNQDGGRCIACENNFMGDKCDVCRPNYKRVISSSGIVTCVPCGCNVIGGIGLETTGSQCDPINGNCFCRRNVWGEKCNQCAPGFYGLSTKGCKPCNCFAAGTMDNSGMCDPITGRCLCKRNVFGIKCDRCKKGHFGLMSSDPDGCQPCFCFTHTTECDVSNRDYYIRNLTFTFPYNATEWKYVNNNDVTSPLNVAESVDDYVTFPRNVARKGRPLSAHLTKVSKPFLTDMYRSYGLYVELELSFKQFPPSRSRKSITPVVASTPDDLRFIMDHHTYSLPFDSLGNPKLHTSADQNTKKRVFRYRLTENAPWQVNRGPPSNRGVTAIEFLGFLSTTANIEIRILTGLDITRVHGITIMTVTSDRSSLSKDQPVHFARVEKCKCPPSLQGDSCEKCAPFYRREIAGQNHYGACVPCRCNRHATTCDEASGRCVCETGYAGKECEMCAPGYYGDALNPLIGCKLCPCPLGGECVEKERRDLLGQWRKMIVCLNCPPLTTGVMCERCESGYYGNPSNGGRCTPCHCNNNENRNAVGICDHKTGVCLACDYNTDGDHCESCLFGYYGNPLAKPHADCKSCDCNPLATIKARDGKVICVPDTGVCVCRNGVKGKRCDRCGSPDYWFNPVVKKCEKCNCSPANSLNTTCHFTTGQCQCKPGSQGKRCDVCSIHYFHYNSSTSQKMALQSRGKTGPYQNGECIPCSCNYIGTELIHSFNIKNPMMKPCDPLTGQCPCRNSNIGGRQCDNCSESLHFNSSSSDMCLPCNGCYSVLRSQVKKWIAGPKQPFNQTLTQDILNEAIRVLESFSWMSNDTELVKNLEKLTRSFEEFQVLWFNMTEQLDYWRLVKNNPSLSDIFSKLAIMDLKLGFESSDITQKLVELLKTLQQELEKKPIDNVELNKLANLINSVLQNIQSLMSAVVNRRLQMQADLIKGILLLGRLSNSSSIENNMRLRRLIDMAESLSKSTNNLERQLNSQSNEMKQMEKEIIESEGVLSSSLLRFNELNWYLDELMVQMWVLSDQMTAYSNIPIRSIVNQSYELLNEKLKTFLKKMNESQVNRDSLSRLYERAYMANDRYHMALNKSLHFIQNFNNTLQAQYLNHTMNEGKKKLDEMWNNSIAILQTKLPLLRRDRERLEFQLVFPSRTIPDLYNQTTELNKKVDQLVELEKDKKQTISQLKPSVENQLKESQNTVNNADNLRKRMEELKTRMKQSSVEKLEMEAALLVTRLKQLKIKNEKPSTIPTSVLQFHNESRDMSNFLRGTNDADTIIINDNVSRIQTALPPLKNLLSLFPDELTSLQQVRRFVEIRNRLMMSEQSHGGHICIYSIGNMQ